ITRSARAAPLATESARAIGCQKVRSRRPMSVSREVLCSSLLSMKGSLAANPITPWHHMAKEIAHAVVRHSFASKRAGSEERGRADQQGDQQPLRLPRRGRARGAEG